MGEKSAINSLSVRGEFNLSSKALKGMIRSVRKENITPRSQISKELVKYYKKYPDVFTVWGEKMLIEGHYKTGIEFVNMACDNADFHKKPGMIFSLSMRVLRKYKMYGEADEILMDAIKKFPDNKFFNSKLGKIYLDKGYGAKAIDLLKPLFDKGIADTVIINTLANAYLHEKKPYDAIKVLKPLYCSGSGDGYTVNILASAYVDVQDRKSFESIKGEITPNSKMLHLSNKLDMLEKSNGTDHKPSL